MLKTILLTCALATGALAQPHEISKFHSNDGMRHDEFGEGVVIAGDVAVVGATRDDDHGPQSGAVHLFDISDPHAPAQLAKFIPEDIGDEDMFGDVLRADGDIVIVGAEFADLGQAVNVGRAYLLDISDPTRPVEFGRLSPSDPQPNMRFAGACAIGGGLALVGAPHMDVTAFETGAAYVFDVESSMQLAKIVPDDGVANDEFGTAVGLDGAIAYISAMSDDNGGSGSVYVYDLADPREPVLLHRIFPSDPVAQMRFGASIDVEAGLLVVGAPTDDAVAMNAGSVYLFDVSNPARPVETATLHNAQAQATDLFGVAVRMHADTLIAASLGEDLNGALHLFDVTDPSEPVERARLVPSDGHDEQFFAFAIDLNDEVILAGAPDDHELGFSAGAAYLFDATPCLIDVNGDGALNILDFVAFQIQWSLGAAVADCNADATLTILDFICFQQLFQAGCK
jgi:hypothetical protein